MVFLRDKDNILFVNHAMVVTWLKEDSYLVGKKNQ